MIMYTCPRCKTLLETDDALGMKDEACPLCKKTNRVPPSKAQKQLQKDKDRAVEELKKSQARQLAELQRLAETTRRAEAECLQKQQETEKQQQYFAAIQQAKANPGTPKVWYCQQNGQERGPMQEALLQKWIDDGQLGPDARVRTKEGNAWIQLRDIPERFHVPVHKTKTFPMSHGQQGQVVAVRPVKSAGISIILTVFLGPLGMFYSTITGAIIMTIVSLPLAVVTFGLGLIVTWPICIIWGALAASSYNKKVARAS